MKAALAERLTRCREVVEAVLDRSLPAADTAPAKVHEAMRYAVFAQAKRLRPALAMLVGEALGEDPARVAEVASAIELIHTYSLIHDDLPCMDDDAMRRGQPTCHVAFGEAVAVLAGDALLTVAFELLIENGRREGYGGDVLLEVVRELSAAAGSQGMIRGQVEDLEAEGRDISLPELEAIHAAKTGRLFTASIRIGARLASADEETMSRLTRYGDAFGKVFQIVDDVLDVVGTTEELGKPVGSDEKNQKATYPRLLGLDEARAEAARHAEAARQEVAFLEERAEPLVALVDYLLERRR
jgi:geranylgeranyl diphosphate synthase type II